MKPEAMTLNVSHKIETTSFVSTDIRHDAITSFHDLTNRQVTDKLEKIATSISYHDEIMRSFWMTLYCSK